MSAETAPKPPVTPPEQIGFNPSDFREPLPYETNSGDGSPTEPAVVAETAPTPTTPAEATPIPVIDADARVDGPPAAEEPAAGPDRAGETLPPDRHAEYERYAKGARDAGVVVAPSYETWQQVHHPEDSPTTEPTTEPEPAREVVVPLGPEAPTPPPDPATPEVERPTPEPEATSVEPVEPVEPAPTPPGGEVSPPPPGGGEDLTTDVDAPAEPEPAPPVEPAVDAEAEAPRIPMTTLPEASKGRLGRLVERITEIPAVKEYLGKRAISKNQNIVDQHQERAVKLTTELHIFDAQLEGFDMAIATLREEANLLRQQASPGAESLELRIQKIERDRANLMAGRDKVQTKLEAADNGARYYTTERDKIADELINFYDERLQPMEKELERLESCRDLVALREAVSEVAIKERLARVEQMNNQKNQIAEAMRAGGAKGGEIARATVVYDEIVASIYEEIRRERDDIAAHKAEIDLEVTIFDGRANPIRDSREQFVRMKNIRPLDLELEPRKRAEEFSGEDRPEIHRRVAPAEASSGRAASGSTAESGPSRTPERAETDTRPTLTEYVDRWNDYAKKTAEDDPRVIGRQDFLRATRMDERTKLDKDDFINILSKYLKSRKKSSEGLNGF